METLAKQIEKNRLSYQPLIPDILHSGLSFSDEKKTTSVGDEKEIAKVFPHIFGSPILKGFSKSSIKTSPLHVGVVFSGGQASGGHNVIGGLFDALKKIHKESKLIGFLNGPSGIIEGKQKEITQDLIDRYRNLGGFDLIGSGRTKIETDEQLASSANTIKELKLDGLVIIGGDDSNTNAAILAEYLLSKDLCTRVIGVPKTIDGDLQNDFIEISFGFDTACKTFSEMIGNICRDALSAKKYYHFIKLMGRSASHIALECALQTQPNLTLIAEEVEKNKKGILDVADEIANLIEKRATLGKNYGVILIPEGLIEFTQDMKTLISELNSIIAKDPALSSDLPLENKLSQIQKLLSLPSLNTLEKIPQAIQKQLLLERDPHGNVQVSMIETDKLLYLLVEKELKKRKEKGTYQGKFSVNSHFFGYEGRAGYPSNFDANYCYSLGIVAASLIVAGYTGYMSCIRKVHLPPKDWEVYGVPLTMMMHMEIRSGKRKPVIKKSLVDLKGQAFSYFAQKRQKWSLEDLYCNPGPIQYCGDRLISDTVPLSTQLKISPASNVSH